MVLGWHACRKLELTLPLSANLSDVRVMSRPLRSLDTNRTRHPVNAKAAGAIAPKAKGKAAPKAKGKAKAKAA